ncbi:PREDICTED: F-box protein At3g19890-like [Camelina sativa]|uniref:F-box protein At3g19890-like n=1 Tax=Camelina sativa TaxID=90675 RepID=A0ABM0WAX3_CAMSA|nr:PREDICTED: F-box protein At3g19890-like [Camelina sativa]
MTMMSDLSPELVDEVLCRAPITSLGAVRSTRKQWNESSKDRLLCNAEPKQQFLGFMVMDHRFLSMTFNLQGILGEDFVRPSIKEINGGNFDNQIDISKVFYSDGLVLCVARDNSTLVVWNPYSGQNRWIHLEEPYHETDMFALGYDKDKNHKILRLYDDYYEYKVYNLESGSWGETDHLPDWDIDSYHRGVALNGNAYFLTKEKGVKAKYRVDYLLCFDFTTEKFGDFLDVPYKHRRNYIGTLSCVGKEKLAVLYQSWDTREMEVWVTTKIEPNEVSWSKFFKVDMKPLIRFGFQREDEAGSFFIDEEKKLAVVFNLDGKSDKRTKKKRCYHTAYVVGEKGYLRKVALGEAVEVDGYRIPLMCCGSYVPSLEKINQNEGVQINQNAGRKTTQDKKRKRKNIR